MKKVVLLLSLIVLFSNIDCNNKASDKRRNSIDSLFKNKFVLSDLENYHIGQCDIDSGILIAQVFDKISRQHPKLYLANILTKEKFGFFEWPDAQDGVYFGTAYSSGKLIYFNDRKNFKVVDLKTKILDMAPIKSTVSEFTKMIIIGQNIYSLSNVYGIDIINLYDTARRLRFVPYKGSYYNEQNNISNPISSTINLVASGNLTNNEYILYAIDSALKIQWAKTITLSDRFLAIKSVSLPDAYVIKFNNRIEVVDKKDGKLQWGLDLDKSVYNIYLNSSNKLIVILSQNKNSLNTLTQDQYDIEQFDLNSKKFEWKHQIYFNENNFFIAGNELFQFGEKDNIRIDRANGEVTHFDCSNKINIIRDRIKGDNFLLSDNIIYW